ncbi:MAG: hypothetical protein ACR2P1_27765 [Pseudomonadales bacterium]
MWDFSISSAIGAMRRTLPYLVVRMLVYFGIALLYIVATGGGGAIGYGFTSFGDGEGAGSIYGALIGFGGASGFLYWAREYILYLVKAGHIAVLTRLYDGKELADGRNQVDYGISVVKDNFKEASILFGLDQLIKGVLKIVTGTLNTIGRIIPIPGLQNLTGMIGKILEMSLTYVDEIIIAHHFRSGSDNPWESSRNALVLYAQNYGTMAKNAAWLWIFMWLLTFVIFLVLLAPALAIISAFPGDIGFWSFVLAFLVAWSVKAALLEPIAIYALMHVFFKTIEGQQPDPEWEARLDKASDKFREIKEKAAGFVAGRTSSQTTGDAMEGGVAS